jgi:hypothetical protein
VFRYRLQSPDGDDLGEATYAQMIKPGEEIIAGARFVEVDSDHYPTLREPELVTGLIRDFLLRNEEVSSG